MENENSLDALKLWLDQTGRKKGWLAKTIGIDGSTISRWMRGGVTPHLIIREKIERLTDGDVPADGWGNDR